MRLRSSRRSAQSDADRIQPSRSARFRLSSTEPTGSSSASSRRGKSAPASASCKRPKRATKASTRSPGSAMPKPGPNSRWSVCARCCASRLTTSARKRRLRYVAIDLHHQVDVAATCQIVEPRPEQAHAATGADKHRNGLANRRLHFGRQAHRQSPGSGFGSRALKPRPAGARRRAASSCTPSAARPAPPRSRPAPQCARRASPRCGRRCTPPRRCCA